MRHALSALRTTSCLTRESASPLSRGRLPAASELTGLKGLNRLNN